MTPEEQAAADKKAAADKAAADKATADKTSATLEAAQKAAVAKILADKADADKGVKDSSTVQLLEIAGWAGGAFTIRGSGFGPSGSLLIGGRPPVVTMWEDDDIRGTIPAGTPSGEIVLIPSNGGPTQRGVFPHVRKRVTTTTTVSQA